MNAEHTAAFDQAKQQGFLRYRSSQSSLASAWRGWCHQQRRPCVTIQVNVQYAILELDLETCGREFTDDGQTEAFNILSSHAAGVKQAGIAGGRRRVYCRRMPLDRADAAAQALLDIVEQVSFPSAEDGSHGP